MKIRCTHNSIRYRLRKSDIATLKAKGQVSDSVTFGRENLFTFSLTIAQQGTELAAEFVNQQINISIPVAIATKWVDTNEVGIERHLSLEKEEVLHLLIEKDFPCLDREEENRDDTFWELAPDEPDNC